FLASSPPFSFSWDSTTFAGGEHKISAIAFGYHNHQQIGGDEVTVKVSNPAVKIEQPTKGTVVSRIVHIDTKRSQEVEWLNLYIHGRYLASSPPFSFTWNSTTVANGTHSISAKGYRSPGALLGSTAVTVQVNN